MERSDAVVANTLHASGCPLQSKSDWVLIAMQSARGTVGRLAQEAPKVLLNAASEVRLVTKLH
jgi:hypothetical protein